MVDSDNMAIGYCVRLVFHSILETTVYTQARMCKRKGNRSRFLEHAHLYIRTFLINKWLQINRQTITAATTKNKSLQNFHFDQTLLKFMVQKFITLTKVKANPFFFFMEIQLLHTYGET